MKGKVSDLYRHLGYWHNRFGQRVHVGFERKLAVYDVTVSQWCVMVTLYQGRADTVRGISRLLCLDGGAVTRLADRLEDKGLLVRLPDEADERSVKFALTGEGKVLVSKLAEAADRNDEEFYGVLSDEELMVYQKILVKLLGAAGTDVLGFCKDFCSGIQIKKKKKE
ncbi:hypothetical protein AYO37_01285 [Opitutia bacterium SCGC AG-212-L18]|nr:hypothetical protein AYO37_01285 [Opitutae bacterium SCGC AG-212-L18]